MSSVFTLKRLISVIQKTAPHFFGIGDAHKEITEQYPDAVSSRRPEDLPERSRGILENDIQICSGCYRCSEVCPTSCISIETEKQGPGQGKWVSIFDIDLSNCAFCGLCVQVCPTTSLKHTHAYEGTSETLDDLIRSFGKGWSTAEMREKWMRHREHQQREEEKQRRTRISPVMSEVRDYFLRKET